MRELSIELRDMARTDGLCDEWFGAWSEDCSDEELFDKYKRGIDFAIEHDYPSNKYILTHWDRETLRRNGIYVNDKVEEDAGGSGTFVVNGDSEVTMRFDAYDAADIYVRHHSVLYLDASYMAKVRINLYDEARVEIGCREGAKAYVYRHSAKCKVIDVGYKPPLIRNKY